MKKRVLRSNEYVVIDRILIEHGIVDQERHENQTAQPSVTDFKSGMLSISPCIEKNGKVNDADLAAQYARRSDSCDSGGENASAWSPSKFWQKFR